MNDVYSYVAMPQFSVSSELNEAMSVAAIGQLEEERIPWLLDAVVQHVHYHLDQSERGRFFREKMRGIEPDDYPIHSPFGNPYGKMTFMCDPAARISFDLAKQFSIDPVLLAVQDIGHDIMQDRPDGLAHGVVVLPILVAGIERHFLIDPTFVQFETENGHGKDQSPGVMMKALEGEQGLLDKLHADGWAEINERTASLYLAAFNKGKTVPDAFSYFRRNLIGNFHRELGLSNNAQHTL